MIQSKVHSFKAHFHVHWKGSTLWEIVLPTFQQSLWLWMELKSYYFLSGIFKICQIFINNHKEHKQTHKVALKVNPTYGKAYFS